MRKIPPIQYSKQISLKYNFQTLPMKTEDIKKQYNILLNAIDRQKYLNIP